MDTHEMTDVRVCPECNGQRIVEYESARPTATPEGPRWMTWRDNCQCCGGDGEIEVSPIEMDDLP